MNNHTQSDSDQNVKSLDSSENDNKSFNTLNDGFYSSRINEEQLHDIDYYSITDSSNYHTEHVCMINQLHNKLQELDDKYNSLNSKNIDEIASLKSLVHSFVKLNDKNKFNDELDMLKSDFKKLYSEHQRAISANKSLNETLQKELSLLSAEISKNKLQIGAKNEKNESSFLEERVKELHSDILLEVGEILDQRLSFINGLYNLSDLSAFNNQNNDYIPEDIVEQSTSASSNNTSSNEETLTSRTNKSKFNDLENKMYSEISEMRESFEEIYNKIGNNNEKIAYLVAKFDDFSSNFNLDEYKFLFEKFDLLSNKIANYDSNIKTNQDSVVKCANNLNKLYSSFNECSDSATMLTSNFEDLSNKVIDLEANLTGEIQELNKSIDGKTALFDSYRSSIDQLQSQININNSLITNIPTQAQFDSISTKLHNLELQQNNTSVLFDTFDKKLGDMKRNYEENEGKIESLQNEVDAFSSLKSDLESRIDYLLNDVMQKTTANLNALRGDLSLEFHDKLNSAIDAKLGSVTNDLADQFDAKLYSLRNELNERLDNKLQSLKSELKEAIESMKNELMEKIEIAARPSDTLQSHELHGAVTDIAKTSHTQNLESVNGIMESAVKSISTDLINISVEKIIYEILDKLENRIESLKGIKETVPLSPEVVKLTIQQHPNLFILPRSEVPIGEGLPREPIRSEVPIGEGLPGEGLPRQGLPREGPIGEVLLREGLPGDDEPDEPVSDLPRSGTLSYHTPKEEPTDNYRQLVSDVQTLKAELSELREEIRGLTQNNIKDIGIQANQLHNTEVRVTELLNHLQDSANQLDIKMMNVNESLQMGSEVIWKLDSLIKKSEEYIKNNERVEYGHVWVEEIPNNQSQQACTLLNQYDIDSNYIIQSNSPINEAIRQTYIGSTPIQTPSHSPILERYIVPLSDSQLTVTRQYVDLTNDPRI